MKRLTKILIGCTIIIGCQDQPSNKSFLSSADLGNKHGKLPQIVLSNILNYDKFEDPVLISNGKAFQLVGKGSSNCKAKEALAAVGHKLDSHISSASESELTEQFGLGQYPKLPCVSIQLENLDEKLQGPKINIVIQDNVTTYYLKDATDPTTYYSIAPACVTGKIGDYMKMSPFSSGRSGRFSFHTSINDLGMETEISIGCSDGNTTNPAFNSQATAKQEGWALFRVQYFENFPVFSRKPAVSDKEDCETLDGTWTTDNECILTEETCSWDFGGTIQNGVCQSLEERSFYLARYVWPKEYGKRKTVYLPILSVNGLDASYMIENQDGNQLITIIERRLSQFFGVPKKAIRDLTEIPQNLGDFPLFDICTQADECDPDFVMKRYEFQLMDDGQGYVVVEDKQSTSIASEKVFDYEIKQHFTTIPYGKSGKLYFGDCLMDQFQLWDGMGINLSRDNFTTDYKYDGNKSQFTSIENRSLDVRANQALKKYIAPCVAGEVKNPVCRLRVSNEDELSESIQGEGCSSDQKVVEITLEKDITLYNGNIKIEDDKRRYLKINGSDKTLKLDCEAGTYGNSQCSVDNPVIIDITAPDTLVSISDLTIDLAQKSTPFKYGIQVEGTSVLFDNINIGTKKSANDIDPVFMVRKGLSYTSNSDLHFKYAIRIRGDDNDKPIVRINEGKYLSGHGISSWNAGLSFIKKPTFFSGYLGLGIAYSDVLIESLSINAPLGIRLNNSELDQVMRHNNSNHVLKIQGPREKHVSGESRESEVFLRSNVTEYYAKKALSARGSNANIFFLEVQGVEEVQSSHQSNIKLQIVNHNNISK